MSLSIKMVLVGLILTAALGFALTAGCSKDELQPSIYEQDWYEGWKFHQCDGIPVKIFYPPDHPHESLLSERCMQYEASIRRASGFLGMDIPTDTLVVFYYTGYGQGRQFTQSMFPFTRDSIIFFWTPSFLGPTLVDWLVQHWVVQEPQQEWYRHGLRALFDFSGQDYHLVTMKRYFEGRFVGLERLASDTTFDSNREREQSAEAASFFGFVLATKGSETLKQMYVSDLSIDVLINLVFGAEIDSVEAEWLQFAAEYVPDSSLQRLKDEARSKK